MKVHQSTVNQERPYIAKANLVQVTKNTVRIPLTDNKNNENA